MLHYSPEPLYLLVFRLFPKNAPLFSKMVHYPPNGVLFPQKTYYSRKKTYYQRPPKLTLLPRKNLYYSPEPCIYLYSGYSQMHHYFLQRCIIPPKGVLLPRKMVCYSPEPLYLLVFRLFPRMVCYYHAKCCITLPNPCIYWCLGYSPKCRITRAKRCVTINE